MIPDTTDLLLAFMQFYGDCLTAYPELLSDPALGAIEAAMRGPADEEGAPEENPAFRLMRFLSEYREADELPSYAAVYAAHEALLEEAARIREGAPSS